MTVAEIQQQFVAAGYQFTEHVFNDRSTANCLINFSKCKSPHHFRSCTYENCAERKNDVGWGRFTRESAWAQAEEWLVR